MKKFNFYHFIDDKNDRPLALLLDKLFLMQKKIVMLCNNDGQKKLLDEGIWNFSNDYFIPHATDDDPSSEEQPILLTCGLINPAKAEVLCLFHEENKSVLEKVNEAKKDGDFYESFSSVLYFYEGDINKTNENKDILKQLDSSDFDVKYFLKVSDDWRRVEIK